MSSPTFVPAGDMERVVYDTDQDGIVDNSENLDGFDSTDFASSTSAALAILVYDGTPSAGDLTTYDEIYTTPALCFAALPAIINHAVTIKIRNADGAAYAAATLQRVVGGGSITIQGEYYYNNTVASAGSEAGKFNTHASHSGLVQAGDKVYLIKYSGTVGASTPSDAFVDTVASVDGTEVTLTTRTSDSFDTSWRYTIVRTECAALTVQYTDSVTIKGLYLKSTNSTRPLTITSSPVVCNYVIAEGSGSSDIVFVSGTISSGNTYMAIINSQATQLLSALSITGSIFSASNSAVFYASTPSTPTRGAVRANSVSQCTFTYSLIQGTGQAVGVGALITYNSTLRLTSCKIDGVDGTYKMSTAILAQNSSTGIPESCTFGYNITTQKSPANWAATTDGSYIS